MAFERNTSLEILQQAEAHGLYALLVNQLRKDFERANVPVGFTDTHTPEELASLLHEKVYQLLMERFQDYLNVLYTIDIPESSFRQLPITDAVEVAGEVGLMMLQREWQKVLLKRQYRS